MTLDPPAPPAAGIPPAHARAIPEVLARYGLEPLSQPEPVAGAVRNPSYRVATRDGDVLVRFHKKGATRQGLAFEHEVIDWAASQGLPVAAALCDRDGHTVQSHGGTLVAVFPFVAGETLERGRIDVAGATALGEAHGWCHAVLAGYPGPVARAWRSGASWDMAASIDVLSRCDDLIRYYPAPGDVQLGIQAGLREQLALLETVGVPRPQEDFRHLPVQLVHGDFHERNVVFGEDGTLAAIVDWEAAGLLPPVFEVVRALTFGGMLHEPLAGAYLAGYQRRARLDPATIADGLELWWQSLLHDTWMYEQRFIQGERAVERFFGEQREHVARFADAAFRRDLASRLIAHSA